MRILHFYKTFNQEAMGGIEKFIEQLVISGLNHGIHNDILTLTTESKVSIIHENGFNIYQIPQDIQIASCPFSFKAIKYFKKLTLDADIIHFHFPWPFADLVYLITQSNKPIIVTYHSDIVKQKYLRYVYYPLMQYFLKKADRIITTSPQYSSNSKILQKFQDKITVVPIGLDKSSYPAPSKERLAYWQKKFPTKFFLFVGALRYYKGLQYLVEAAAAVAAPIVIIGDGKEIEQQLKQHIKEKNINTVYFLGAVTEVNKTALLTLCYAFVLPSHLRSEAFGVALLEGAMFGKPMISCEIFTGTTYINQADETGLVVPPADPISLANAMNRLLYNEELALNMGKKAFMRYEQFFSAKKMAECYLELYKTYLKN